MPHELNAAVTSPHQMSDTGPGRSDDLRIDAWDLCAEFVEQMVSEAHAAAAEKHRDHDLPEIDWGSIWQAGEGAPSDESAIGRILLAASESARAIALRPLPKPSSPAPTAGRNGAGANGTATLARPVETADLHYPDPDLAAAPIGLVTAPAETPVVTEQPEVAEPDQQLTVADQMTQSVVTEPVVTEPVVTAPVVTAPVVTAPVVNRPVVTEVGSVKALTVAPPQSPVTEQIEVVVPIPEPAVSAAPVSGAVSFEQIDDSIARTAHDAPTRSVWDHVFTWMIAIGVIVLLFVVWQLWGTDISQHQAQSQLKSQFDTELRTHHPPVGTKPGSLIPAGTRYGAAADGSVLARLQIPAIGVDEYVVEGTNAGDLSKGPGHYVGTALPGQAGNVAIAGHRTTHGAPFNGLGHLARGDRIILTTSWGEHLTYAVSGTPQVVSPSDVAVLNYFADNRITLTTCNPEFSSSQRLVAVGKLDQPEQTPKPAKSITYHIAGSDTSNWNWSSLPVLGIEISLLLLLGLSYRFFGVWFESRIKWLILVPLWAAGLYLLFSTLTTFLPSTV